MSALDFIVVKNVEFAGVLLPPRVAINFIGSGWNVVDNPANNSTDVSNTGSGGVSVTGYGLVHVTNGTIDSGAFLGSGAQIPIVNTGGTDVAWHTLAQDVSLTGAGVVTVIGIRGFSVPSPSGSNTVLTYNSGSFTWGTGGSGGISALTGDVSASGSGSVVSTVVGLQTYAVSASAPASANLLLFNSSVWTPTPMTGDVAISGSGATTLGAISGVTLPAPSGGSTFLHYNGSALSWTAGSGGTSVTGTGLWYSASGTLNAAAITIGGDVTEGALSGSTVPLTVTGLQGIAVPSPTGSGTVLTYNTGAYTWGSGGSGGGITALTGDVTASGSGSVAATVVAISGSSPISITPSILRWMQGSAGPTLSQAQQNNSSQPANFTVSPQAPGASPINSAAGTPGSFIVDLAAPTGAGVEASFQVTRAGGATTTIGTDPGAPAYAQITMAGTPIILTNGSNATYFGYSLSGALNVTPYGSVQLTSPNVGWQLGANAPDFGGGNVVVGITKAAQIPTSAPSTKGDAVIYGNATNGFFGINSLGLEFPICAGTGGVIPIIAASPTSGTVAGNSLFIIAAAGSGGANAGGVLLGAGDSTAEVTVQPSLISVDAPSAIATAIGIGVNTTGVITVGNTAATLNIGASVASSATSGTASALPSTPSQYVQIQVNGVARKVAVYNT